MGAAVQASLIAFARSLGCLLLAFRGGLREPTTAASRRVLVDRPTLRRAVERARGCRDRVGGGLAALGDRLARRLHRGACGRATERLDRGASLGLPDPLEGRALALLRCHGAKR